MGLGSTARKALAGFGASINLQGSQNGRSKKLRRSTRLLSDVARTSLERLEDRTLFSTVAVYHFDQSAPAPAVDSSGHGYNAALYGSATVVTGHSGNALSLAGSGYVQAGSLLDVTGSYTVSAWVKWDGSTGFHTAVSQDGSQVSAFYLQFRDDTRKFAFSAFNGDSTSASNPRVDALAAPVANQWYYLTGEYDAAAQQLRFYVNGSLQGQTSFHNTVAFPGNTTIGAAKYGGNRVDFFTGQIDDVDIEDSALTQPQIVAAGGISTVALWRFEDASSGGALDSTPNGNPLELSGTTITPGKSGNALTLSGSGAYGQALTSLVDVTQSYSVSAWVNWSGASGFRTILSQDGNQTSGFFLQVRGDNEHFSFVTQATDSTSSAQGRVDSISAPQPNQWYYLTGVYDAAADQIRLYVNGQLQGQAAFTATTGFTGSTAVGRGMWNGSPTDFFDGQIDNAKIDRTSLTQAQINADAGLSAPMGDSDIGAPSIAGLATFDPATGVYSLSASGADIWQTSDQFNYDSQPAVGDGQIVARLTSAAEANGNLPAYGKAGLMFRDTAQADSAFVQFVYTNNIGLQLIYRSGANTSASVAGQLNEQFQPTFLRLTRIGNIFTGYYSSDGSTWTSIGSTPSVPLNYSGLAGLVACSHDNGTLASATFDHVSFGSAQAVSQTEATLAWTAPWTSSAGSTIYVSYDSGATFTPIGQVGPGLTAYDATGLTASATETFAISNSSSAATTSGGVIPPGGTTAVSTVPPVDSVFVVTSTALTYYKVTASTTLQHGIADNSDTGTVTVGSPWVWASSPLQAAQKAAITVGNYVATTPQGARLYSFKSSVLAADQTGGTVAQPSNNEPSLATAENIPTGQPVLAIEDGSDNDFNDAFASISVTAQTGISGQVTASVPGVPITATVDADNHYGLYYGGADGSNLTFVGRNEVGAIGSQGGYNWTNGEHFQFFPPASSYIYVVAWNTDSSNMLIGQFNLPGGQTLVTNPNDWQYILGGTNPGDVGQVPDPAILAGQIAAGNITGSWSSDLASLPNGAGPWGTLPDFGSAASTIWPGSLGDATYQGNCVIFRAAIPAGLQYQNDTGVAGRTVYIDSNGNGQFDPGEPSTLTDANGRYAITGLSPGTYSVREVVPENWSESSPSNGFESVTVTNGTTADGVDFTTDATPTISSVTSSSVDDEGNVQLTVAAADPLGNNGAVAFHWAPVGGTGAVAPPVFSQNNSPGANNILAHFPGPGTYPIEVIGKTLLGQTSSHIITIVVPAVASGSSDPSDTTGWGDVGVTDEHHVITQAVGGRESWTYLDAPILPVSFDQTGVIDDFPADGTLDEHRVLFGFSDIGGYVSTTNAILQFTGYGTELGYTIQAVGPSTDGKSHFDDLTKFGSSIYVGPGTSYSVNVTAAVNQELAAGLRYVQFLISLPTDENHRSGNIYNFASKFPGQFPASYSPSLTVTSPAVKPAAASQLTATRTTGSNVAITWNYSPGKTYANNGTSGLLIPTGFTLLRSTNGGAFQTLFDIPAGTWPTTGGTDPITSLFGGASGTKSFSTIDPTALPMNQYTYEIRAYVTDTASQPPGQRVYSVASNTATVPAEVAPQPIQLAAYADSPTTIGLVWDADPSGTASGYDVYRSTDPNFTVSPATLITPTPVTGTTFEDLGPLDPGTVYYYRVTALIPDGRQSIPSDLAGASWAGGSVGADPYAPTGLAAAGVSPSEIDLTWLSHLPVDQYVIERGLAEVGPFTQIDEVGGSTNFYQDTQGLSVGTLYFYRVQGIVNGVATGVSNVASAEPLISQTAGGGSSLPPPGYPGGPSDGGSTPTTGDPGGTTDGSGDGGQGTGGSSGSTGPELKPYYVQTPVFSNSGGDQTDAVDNLKLKSHWVMAYSAEDALQKSITGYIYMPNDQELAAGYHTDAIYPENHPFGDRAFLMDAVNWDPSADNSVGGFDATVEVRSNCDADERGPQFPNGEGFDDIIINFEVDPAPGDLDIDSLNVSDGLPSVSGPLADSVHKIQDDPARSGKIIVLNDADRNGNGVPDFVDGVTSTVGASATASQNQTFVPMVVVIPQNVDPTVAKLQFDYDGSDPTQVTGPSTSSGGYTLPTQGHLRLWLKDGSQTRSGLGANGGGDYVSPGVEFDASDLQWSPGPNGGQQATLYVEAVVPSLKLGDQRIRARVDPDGNGSDGSAGDGSSLIDLGAVRVTGIQDSIFDYGSNGNTLDNAATNSSGEDPAGLNYQGDVRLSDGTVRHTATDFTTDGLGLPWGVTRTWSSQLLIAAVGSANGNGWSDSEWPHLIQGTSTIVAVLGGNAIYFDRAPDGTYAPRFFSPDKLVESGNAYSLTDSMGDQFQFNSFAVQDPTDPTKGMFKRGGLASYTDADGQTATVASWDNLGNITEIDRGQDTFTYGYNAPQKETETLSQVQAKRAGTVIDEANYTFYSGSSFGDSGDLRSAVVKTISAGQLVETSGSYYRYQPSANGKGGKLLFAVEGSDYAGLRAAVGGADSALDGASNTQVQQFATTAVTYDGNGRAQSQTIQGGGNVGDATTSIPSNTRGTFTYDYGSQTPSKPVGINFWSHKTTVTRPDNNSEIAYSNAYGELMLSSLQATLSWDTFYAYDSRGRLSTTALPSAISASTTSLEALPDLMGSQGNGLYQNLNPTEGVVTYFGYYGPGDSAPGYLKQTSLRDDDGGGNLLQSYFKYDQPVAFGSITLHPVTSATTFANDTTSAPSGAPGERTSSFSYTYSGAHLSAMVTTLPSIASDQNPNTHSAGNTATETFDAYGNLNGGKDANLNVTHQDYDPATDELLTSTDGLENFTQVTAHDFYGRPTQILDPMQNQTVISYTDGLDFSTVRTTPAIGPTTVVRTNWKAGYVETYSVPNSATVGTGALLSLSVVYLDTAGRSLAGRRYYDLSNQTEATITSGDPPATGYYVTSAGYDTLGRMNTSTDAVGETTATTYTPTGWVKTVSIGTGSSSNVVTNDTYDNGVAGDGNLTEEVDSPGAGLNDRVTQNAFDWRDREVVSANSVSATYNTFNNAGEITQSDVYDTSNSGIPQFPDGVHDEAQQMNQSDLRARSLTNYDNRGLAYRAQQLSVDQYNGTVDNSAAGTLTTNIFHDSDGNVVETDSPSGLVTGVSFDSDNRPFLTTTGGGDGGGGGPTTALETDQNTFDKDGNTTLTATTLYGPTGTPDRTSYVASVFNQINQITMVADFGTIASINGIALSPGGQAPTGDQISAAVAFASTHNQYGPLVTSYSYDYTARSMTTVDPRNIPTFTQLDSLGRTTLTVQSANYGPTTSRNLSTAYTYNGINEQLTVSVSSPATGTTTQLTTYAYGASNGPTTNADLLASVNQPDGSSSSYKYDLLGETVQQNSANGSVHKYQYDAAGRETSDTTTTYPDFSDPLYGLDPTEPPPAPALNSYVQKLTYQYSAIGELQEAVSFTNSTVGSTNANYSPVNDVRRVYNGFGQVVAEYTSPTGLIPANANTSTYTNVTQYHYGSGASGSLLNSIQYPHTTLGGTRTITYSYGSAGSVNAQIGRIESVSDSQAGLLESYKYLGLDTIVDRQTASPRGPGLDLSYMQTSTAGATSYPGFDPFGRVVSQSWTMPDATTASGVKSIDYFQYGYDSDSNLLYASNVLAPSQSEAFSIGTNTFDSLNRETEFNRGLLTFAADGTVASVSAVNADSSTATMTAVPNLQLWTQDPLGDWTSFKSQGAAYSNTFQDFVRSDSSFNQPAGPNTSEIDKVVTPGTRNGNDTVARGSGFDAWDRLTESEYQAASGFDAGMTQQFDAIGRAYQQQNFYVQRGTDSSGNMTYGTIQQSAQGFVYDLSGNVIQEVDQAGNLRESIYSPVDGRLIMTEAISPGSPGDSASRTDYYPVNDAGGNIVAVVQWVAPTGDPGAGGTNGYGKVVERYVYTPGGQFAVLTPDWKTPPSPASSYGSSIGWEYFYHGMRWNGFDAMYLQGTTAYDPFLSHWQRPLRGDPIGVNSFHGGSGGEQYTGTSDEQDWLTYWPDDIVGTAQSMEIEMGGRLLDYTNSQLYDETMWGSYVLHGFDWTNASGYQFYSGNFSQLGRLSGSDNTSWWAATGSSVPLIGSGYNAFTGNDLLTGEPLGRDRAAAWFAFGADFAFLLAGGLKLAKWDPEIFRFTAGVDAGYAIENARFRGEPRAYGTGQRSARVTAIANEAAKAAGLNSIYDVVDVVKYEAGGGSYFDVDRVTGSRILVIGDTAFGRTGIGQLLEASHEIVHAEQYAKSLKAAGGNFSVACQDFFDANPFGSSGYAWDEVVAERVALARVQRYAGGLSPQQVGASTGYINYWKARI